MFPLYMPQVAQIFAHIFFQDLQAPLQSNQGAQDQAATMEGWLLVPAPSYLSVHDPAAGFTSGGLQKDFLLLMALGRAFCKVYIRMPWPTNCRLLIIYFAQQFVKAATELAGQPMVVSCFRCGQEEELASLNSPAKVVKVLLRYFQKGLRHS